MATDPDVIVVGGGPAGAITSLLLARLGIRVTLVQRASPQERVVSEVLPPAGRPALARLGLEGVLSDPAHVPSPGTVSAWGGQVAEVDYVRSPFGDGVVLDRERFDGRLRGAAVDEGAVLADASQQLPLPRVLVDCTGRASALVRGQGALVERLDGLIGVAGVLGAPATEADGDRRTFVASVPEGWWFSVRRADGRRVAVFHTDADLLDDQVRQRPDAWYARLLEVPLIGQLVAASGAQPPDELRVLAADSRRLIAASDAGEGASAAPPADGPLLLVAGDAGMAFDPLSSQGILSAMQSAEEVVPVVRAALSGEGRALASAIEARVISDDTRWSRYVARLAQAYADETRWPSSPFWERRHAWARSSEAVHLPTG